MAATQVIARNGARAPHALWTAGSSTDMDNIVGPDPCDQCYRTDLSELFEWTGSTWEQVSSAGASGYQPSLRDEYLMPTGAAYETVPRSACNSAQGVTSGFLEVSAIALPSGFPVGHIAFPSCSQAAVTPAHWWFCLLDDDLNLLAVTADQTTAAWATYTLQSLAVAEIASGAASSFTTTYAGLHYLGVMVNAATTPTFFSAAPISPNILGFAPQLSGNTNATGKTTPPAFPLQPSMGSTINQIYGYVGT